MKPIVFLGSSLASIRAFPAAVKREAGYELDKVQRGEPPKDWKTMPNLGVGIREIRIRIGGAWRVVYIASREEAIYVLHAFQKKTTARHRRHRVRFEGIAMSTKKFDSVWDALEDDPVKREIYKLRSELMHVITAHIKANKLKQREVAQLLGISQPRVSTLMKGDFESFRLDTLVGFALKCGHTVSIDAA